MEKPIPLDTLGAELRAPRRECDWLGCVAARRGNEKGGNCRRTTCITSRWDEPGTFHIRPPVRSSFISEKHILDDWTNPSILPFSMPTSPCCTQGCLGSGEAYSNCHRVKARWTSQIGQSFCLDQSALPTWMKAENGFSSQLWRKAPPAPLCFSFFFRNVVLFCGWL